MYLYFDDAFCLQPVHVRLCGAEFRCPENEPGQTGDGLILFYISFFHGAVLTGTFSKDPEVILAAADYLRAYAIDTLLVSFLFCFIGYFNGCGRTTFVMLQGILGAFAIRIPVSYLMSRQPEASLFQVGLAIPLSTVMQIALCSAYFLYPEKRRLA